MGQLVQISHSIIAEAEISRPFFFFVQKPCIIPPSQNRVAVLEEWKQIKDIKRKSHHLYWNTTVLRVQVFCRIITSIVKIFPPRSFKFASDHIKDIKDLRLQETTVWTRIPFSFKDLSGKGIWNEFPLGKTVQAFLLCSYNTKLSLVLHTLGNTATAW